MEASGTFTTQICRVRSRLCWSVR